MANTAVLMEEDEQRRQQLLSLAEKLFTQQVKLFLRYNIQIKELERSLRWAAIQVAARDPEFAIEDRDKGYEQSFSHVAVTTGLTRQEVSTRIANGHAQTDTNGAGLSRLIRILTGWRTEEGYQDENGRPLDIPLRGNPPSFHQLCIKYGRDTPTRPIADALVKNGNVEWIGERGNHSRDKVLRYLHPVVTADINSEDDLNVLAQIGSDFMHAYQEAFDSKVELQPRFREGYLNDIDTDRLPEAIEFIHEEIQNFTVRCTDGLAGFRTDSAKPKVRLGVGAYSYKGAPLFVEVEESESE